jgi:hypothetical protein
MVARRVNGSGALVWQNVAVQGILYEAALAFDESMAVSDGDDGAVVAFEDYRQSNVSGCDISAQRILSNGQLGNPDSSAVTIRLAPCIPLSLSENFVQFTLPSSDQIELNLFDLLGRRMAALEDGYHAAGEHTVRFDQRAFPSGMYLIRLEAGGEVAVKKIVVVR